MRPWLAVVSGFLGAGKTTLILAAARALEQRGLRSAIILNDQSEGLVDTAMVDRAGFLAAEVTGGCFCCRFTDLADAAERLASHQPHVIFAEAVGSCVDIAATVVRPLERDFSSDYRVAPLTVLVDPERMRTLDDPDMAFLFHNQVNEADIVCFTKSDLYPEPPSRDGARQVSATTGQGVEAWLDELLAGELAAGQHPIEIDYDRYAAAEAALAWLNFEGALEFDEPTPASIVVGPLLEDLDQQLTASHSRIAHLKITATSDAGYLKAALAASGQEPAVEGQLNAPPSLRHQLLINLRATGDPANVRMIVENQLRSLPARLEYNRLSCFRPARPQPERRVP